MSVAGTLCVPLKLRLICFGRQSDCSQEKKLNISMPRHLSMRCVVFMFMWNSMYMPMLDMFPYPCACPTTAPRCCGQPHRCALICGLFKAKGPLSPLDSDAAHDRTLGSFVQDEVEKRQRGQRVRQQRTSPLQLRDEGRAAQSPCCGFSSFRLVLESKLPRRILFRVLLDFCHSRAPTLVITTTRGLRGNGCGSRISTGFRSESDLEAIMFSASCLLSSCDLVCPDALSEAEQPLTATLEPERV